MAVLGVASTAPLERSPSGNITRLKTIQELRGYNYHSQISIMRNSGCWLHWFSAVRDLFCCKCTNPLMETSPGFWTHTGGPKSNSQYSHRPIFGGANVTIACMNACIYSILQHANPYIVHNYTHRISRHVISCHISNLARGSMWKLWKWRPWEPRTAVDWWFSTASPEPL